MIENKDLDLNEDALLSDRLTRLPSRTKVVGLEQNKRKKPHLCLRKI